MDVIMPQLGETVLEGSVLTWYKKPGDVVRAGEPLFEVETEKVTTEVPAPAAGLLSEILVPAGVTVAVGTRLAIIGTEAVSTETQKSAGSPATATDDVTASVTSAGRQSPSATTRPGGLRLSPVVRRLMREHSIDPRTISGTGRDGRITREDAFACVRSLARGTAEIGPTSATGPEAEQYTVPLNRVRRITAAHMVRSKATSPHVLQAVEVDFHGVDQARQTFGTHWREQHGHSLTYLPFVARAICQAIAQFPYVNAFFGRDELIVQRHVHLGIAVDLNFEGLAVAVIRDASRHTLRGLATEMHRLADRVRRATALPDEQTGSTYTISNSGSFGTYFSAPIINQPQVAILSVDGVRKRPVVIEQEDGDAIAIRPVGVLAQCFDHRAFDGAYSAAFLRCVKNIIEEANWTRELE